MRSKRVQRVVGDQTPPHERPECLHGFVGEAAAGGLVERAKEGGAELVVFPEVAETGYSMPVIQACATSWSEGAVPEMQRMAKNLSICPCNYLR